MKRLAPCLSWSQIPAIVPVTFESKDRYYAQNAPHNIEDLDPKKNIEDKNTSSCLISRSLQPHLQIKDVKFKVVS